MVGALLDEARRGAHRIARRHRHRIVQVVAGNLERMPRLLLQGAGRATLTGSLLSPHTPVQHCPVPARTLSSVISPSPRNGSQDLSGGLSFPCL